MTSYSWPDVRSGVWLALWIRVLVVSVLRSILLEYNVSIQGVGVEAEEER